MLSKPDVQFKTPKNKKTDVVGQLYTIEWPESNEVALCDSLNKLLGEMSIFATEKQEQQARKKLQNIYTDDQKILPSINDEILRHPSSYKQLLRYVKHHLKPRPNVPFLTETDQTLIAESLLSQIMHMWEDMKFRVDDPFMNLQENREIARRICVYIVTACEQLFEWYLNHAKLLHNRGIFTDRANVTRIKAKLALHAHKVLNYLNVRRRVLDEFRALKRSAGLFTSNYNPEVHNVPKVRESVPTTLLTGIDLEFYNAMPSLNKDTMMSLVSEIALNSLKLERDDAEPPVAEFNKVSQDYLTDVKDATLVTTHSILRKWTSMPILPHRRLLDELGLENSPSRLSKSLTNLEHTIDCVAAQEKHVSTREERIRADLEHLIDCPKQPICGVKDIDELPPLLQAISHNYGTGKKKYQTILQEMEKQEEIKQRSKIKNKLHAPPQHPQPATIDRVLPNRMPVKVADARISRRTAMGSVPLTSFPPVFNDLTDEIELETVKSLDEPLHRMNEIVKVYKEIMSSLSHSHFNISENAAVKLSPDTTEAVRYKNRSVEDRVDHRGRIVNQNLVKSPTTPWTKKVGSWCKVPEEALSTDNLPSFNPDMTLIQERLRNLIDPEGGIAEFPMIMIEKMKRQYEYWISWWKLIIGFDDYLKFLTLKQSDYVGVIFHLFEDSSPTVTTVNKTPELKEWEVDEVQLSVSEKAKLEDLRSVKDHFESGMWNPRCVLMNGLGNDPDLTELLDGKVSNTELNPEQNTMDIFSSVFQLPAHLQVSGSEKDSPTILKVTNAQFADNEKLTKLQNMLDKIWESLRMPEGERLDMALKYSPLHQQSKLHHLCIRLLSVATLINKREELLSKLEKFERFASDPDRFFHKGEGKGYNYLARFEESKERDQIESKLKELEEPILEKIKFIQKTFDECVAYNGRDYMEKMKYDKIELLYWLQEERKQNALKFEVAQKRISLKPVELKPLLM